MKKKKIIFGVMCSVLFVGKVSAADSTYIKYTDENNANYKFSIGSLGGVELNISGGDYYVLLTNSETLPDVTSVLSEEDGGCKVAADLSISNAVDHWKNVGSKGLISGSQEWNLLKGYENAYVIKQYTKEGKKYCEVTNNPIKVEKKTLPLGDRYDTFLFDVTSPTPEMTSFIKYKASSAENYFIGNSKRTVKIGKITDTTLLNRLLTKKADLNELKKYAIDAEGQTWEFSLDETKKDVNGFKAENGSYYFIYTYFNTPEYRPELDDVIFTKAVNGSVSASNIEYKTDEPSQPATTPEPTTPAEEPKEDVKNPETGIKKYIFASIGVLLIAGIALLITNNKGYFKKI